MKPHLKLNEKLILLELAASVKNVSSACEYMGVSRKTYYQIKKAYDAGGVEALERNNRKGPNHKNRIPKKIESEVLKFSLQAPMLGKNKVSATLKKKGFQVSPTGIRNIWVRHGLETKEERMIASGKFSGIAARMNHVGKQ